MLDPLPKHAKPDKVDEGALYKQRVDEPVRLDPQEFLQRWGSLDKAENPSQEITRLQTKLAELEDRLLQLSTIAPEDVSRQPLAPPSKMLESPEVPMPLPWAPTISGSTLTIASPIFLRSPKYFIPSDPTFSLVADDGDGDYYCGVKISLFDHTIDGTVLLSKTLSNVVYTSLAAANADADYQRLLVCILTFADPVWSLKLRCISSVPELGVYASS